MYKCNICGESIGGGGHLCGGGGGGGASSPTGPAAGAGYVGSPPIGVGGAAELDIAGALAECLKSIAVKMSMEIPDELAWCMFAAAELSLSSADMEEIGKQADAMLDQFRKRFKEPTP